MNYQSSATRGRLKSTKSEQEGLQCLHRSLLLHWLVDGCVCMVIKCIKLTGHQLSVVPWQHLINNCRGVGSEVRKVAPVVHYQVKTVLGSTRTRAGGQNV